ncbi:hypothetical protein HLB44_09625 [Aquincola sp. S2]|uniref:Uncharacterized protein n=1 Tax=Pseudaquabacterium terrae TaxID=2732868 RepID=A0ABX2EF56_9BURK|nr:hypothetical protein [Aquabacterium terrae]NRF67241.1 hypothetical protein [Aquabacterium terrae]
MTLPFDFSTALWLRSVPVWEWEALPPPPPPTDDTAPAADAAAPADPKPPAVPVAGEREGFQRVFKGYEIAASVFAYPADSPLSRPWLTHDAADDRRPRADEVDDDAAARAALLHAANDDGAEPT